MAELKPLRRAEMIRAIGLTLATIGGASIFFGMAAAVFAYPVGQVTGCLGAGLICIIAAMFMLEA